MEKNSADVKEKISEAEGDEGYDERIDYPPPKSPKCKSPTSPKIKTLHSPRKLSSKNVQYMIKRMIVKKLYSKKNQKKPADILDEIERADEKEEGVLPRSIVERILDDELAKPLTGREKEYLFDNLAEENDKERIMYKTILKLLSIGEDIDDSDLSLSSSSSCDSDRESNKSPLKQKNSSIASQLLGKEYLLGERKLREFIERESHAMNSVDNCINLLDLLQLRDSHINGEITGTLKKEDIADVFIKGDCPLSRKQLLAILLESSYGDEGEMRYLDFLQEYGYKSVGGSFSQLLHALQNNSNENSPDSLFVFKEALEKQDTKSNGTITGFLSFRDLLLIIHELNLSITKEEAMSLCGVRRNKYHEEKVLLNYRQLIEFLREKRNERFHQSEDHFPCEDDFVFRQLGSKAVAKSPSKDIVLLLRRSFEAADEMKNGSLCGVLNEKDFFTVLNVLGMVSTYSEREFIKAALSNIGALSHTTINYNRFLKRFARNIPNKETKTDIQTAPSPKAQHSVREYMETSATKEERENFAQLMNFVNTIQYHSSPRRANNNDNAVLSPRRRLSYDKDEIICHLGPKLKVALRFEI